MLIEELPEPYKTIAKARRKEGWKVAKLTSAIDDECENRYETLDSFLWAETPEGHNYWEILYDAPADIKLHMLNTTRTHLGKQVYKYLHMKIKI